MWLEYMQIRIDVADRAWCFPLLKITRPGEQFGAAVSDTDILRFHIGVDPDICRRHEGRVIGAGRQCTHNRYRCERAKTRHCFSSPKTRRVADRAVTGLPSTSALSRKAAVVSRLKPAVRYPPCAVCPIESPRLVISTTSPANVSGAAGARTVTSSRPTA